MDATNSWLGVGVSLSVSNDAASGSSALALSGVGHARLSYDRLAGVPLPNYDRLVMDVRLPGGQVADFGVVANGFPLTQGIAYPRWAKYDESTPSGPWMEYACDLRLCEWAGGSASMVDSNAAALSLVYTPGKGSPAILVDNLRLVSDPVRIAYDWLPPTAPLGVFTNPDHTVYYGKDVTVSNASGRPIRVTLGFSTNSLRLFSGTVTPPAAWLAAGTSLIFRVRIDAPTNRPPLEHELQTLELIPGGDARLTQRLDILTAAPFAPVHKPFTLGGATVTKPSGVDAAMAAMPSPMRLPAKPCIWMSQTLQNSYGTWVQGGVRPLPEEFDCLTNVQSGAIERGTALTGGVFHRWLISVATKLSRAYVATGDIQYAWKAREIFLAYAAGYHTYALDRPLIEASSFLAPNNSTYVLGTVIMTPMTRSLDLIWDSGVLSDPDKRTIIDGFLYPAALEMMKINPGMSNMQDAMNEALFNAGLLADDPNLVALALYGSHGLEAKINMVFDEDGATPESIALNYHDAALTPVLSQVQSVTNSGLDVDLNFARLEKAKKLMSLLRMPDGRVPNRGDCPYPSGSPNSELYTYGSTSFVHFGMTLLREGRDSNALYVALDHRPPAVSHSHHDKLSIALYGKGELLGVDDGSLYNMDVSQQQSQTNWSRRSAWGTHALVHNTITVDTNDQQFAGGTLLYYHGATGGYQAVAASTDNAYLGVTLERSIVVLSGVVVMVDRCLSSMPHTYDWTHHSFGVLTAPTGLTARAQLGAASPYSLPESVRMGAPAEPAEFTWQRASASLRLTVLPEAGTTSEYATATGWANQAYRLARQDAPFVLVRRQGAQQRFVTVMEPFKGAQPSVTAIARVPVTAAGQAVPDADAVGLRIDRAASAPLYFLVSFAPGQKQCGPIDSAERCVALSQ